MNGQQPTLTDPVRTKLATALDHLTHEPHDPNAVVANLFRADLLRLQGKMPEARQALTLAKDNMCKTGWYYGDWPQLKLEAIGLKLDSARGRIDRARALQFIEHIRTLPSVPESISADAQTISDNLPP
jgi:hypothetical protein